MGQDVAYFDIDQLAEAIRRRCPEVVFALLHGSASEGAVKPGSDVDIALYLDRKPTLDIYSKVYEAARDVDITEHLDVGILNKADPVYRFEALKGRLLFNNDKETYLRFFSLTCREYESQMASYERQHRYRLEYSKKQL